MLPRILMNEAGMWAFPVKEQFQCLRLTPQRGVGIGFGLLGSACPTCVRTSSELEHRRGPWGGRNQLAKVKSKTWRQWRARVLVLALVSSSGVGGKILRDSISSSVKCGENAHLTRADDGNTRPPTPHSLLLPPGSYLLLISICLEFVPFLSS